MSPSSSYDADLLIVGAGPAGVAAAVMAASLDMGCTVIEADRVGSKLHTIHALENVPGSWSEGPHLAEALAQDLVRLQEPGRCTVVEARAVSVTGHDHHADVVLADDRILTGQAVLVATGVSAQRPADAQWVSAPEDFMPEPLWRARPEDLHGRTYVLGADRPLGTWLRAHPEVKRTLHVLCPPGDGYKAAEVASDERVRLVPVSQVTVSAASYGPKWSMEVKDPHGERAEYAVDTVLANLGNSPVALPGLVRGDDGYCPPDLQHPRILTAGDLRSARYQRIVTAQGSGAEAALSRFYGIALQRA